MNKPKGYCAEWGQSVRERHTPYDSSYMWNQQTKIKQNRNRLTDIVNKLVAAREGRWIGKTGKGIKRYKFPVIK